MSREIFLSSCRRSKKSSHGRSLDSSSKKSPYLRGPERNPIPPLDSGLTRTQTKQIKQSFLVFVSLSLSL